MNKLVELSNVPKATILYYIKEGLLPQPDKPKPNLHLYSEEALELLEFIKYLQKNFECSISEIKEVVNVQKANNLSSYEALLEVVDLIMGNKYQLKFSFDEIAREFKISREQLQSYLDEGILFVRDGLFSQKEKEILQIILDLEALDGDRALLKTYAAQARELAKMEIEMTQKILQSSTSNNATIKRLFDTILILKPYIYNMSTLGEYKGKKL
ncbi:MAG: MerR family transcriptional regulator [Campylobacterales bacterium]|nr:MerR family transcriptional regulator [Campylobacterales bacterium]